MRIAEGIHAKEMYEMDVHLERLNKRFDCGHRIVDWDDSYGECVVCKIKKRADDYENLPRTVIECHDKIEELQEEITRLNGLTNSPHS
jgi:hypothetical protein